MQKYIAIEIQGYNEILEGGKVGDVTTITLMENDPNVALARAEQLIKKEHYRVANIVENYVRS